MLRLVGALLALFIFFSAHNVAYAACTSPAGVAGDVVYNTAQKTFQYCNNSNWVGMNAKPGSGSGGCTNPTLAEGQIVYNADNRVLQGCAGNVHRGFGPLGGGVGNGWKDISGRLQHTCGIHTDGTLWCWGYNLYGTLGDNSTTNRTGPTPVNGGGTWKKIETGYDSTCGIKSDDTLWCWGRNNSGQVGDNTTTQRLIPTAVAGGGTWKDVSVESFHVCGIKSDDSLWCWGSNSSGATGQNTAAGNTLSPAQINGGGSWKKIVSGYVTSCGIKSDDSLWCWGSRAYGGTGQNNATGNDLVPVPISGGGTWKHINMSVNPGGHQSSCGIKTDDSLWCWGSNSFGQLGDGTSTQRLVPTAVSGGGTWKYVHTGYTHTCGIKSDDTLWCWGRGHDGSTTNILIPTAFAEGGTWKHVTGGFNYTCGIQTSNALRCLGNNGSGQLGDDVLPSLTIPREISGGGLWKRVITANLYTCAIKTDETLWCWGANGSSKLGDGTTTERWVPTAVSGGGTWKDVDGGKEHTCGIQTGGSLWCWGYNNSGQIGDATTTDRSVPTAISGGGVWKQVSVNGDAIRHHTCAIKSDDTLWCWGNNNSGRLGDGTSTNRNIPTAISGGGTWKKVSLGESYTCAIKSDDTLWCWGNNTFSQLADGTSTNRLVPTAVAGGGTWKHIIGYSQSNNCGVKSDDSVWCWGDGINIPTAAGVFWSNVGVNFPCGLKSDKTISCVLTGIIETFPMPGIQWDSIDSRFPNPYYCGISNSKLLCWGNNSNGQLTATQYSTPAPRTYSVQPLCGAPPGKAGKVVFNSATNVLQYCTGDGWVGIR